MEARPGTRQSYSPRYRRMPGSSGPGSGLLCCLDNTHWSVVRPMVLARYRPAASRELFLMGQLGIIKSLFRLGRVVTEKGLSPPQAAGFQPRRLGVRGLIQRPVCIL